MRESGYLKFFRNKTFKVPDQSQGINIDQFAYE